jgi:hypothetical protein
LLQAEEEVEYERQLLQQKTISSSNSNSGSIGSDVVSETGPLSLESSVVAESKGDNEGGVVDEEGTGQLSSI